MIGLALPGSGDGEGGSGSVQREGKMEEEGCAVACDHRELAWLGVSTVLV